VNNNGIPISTAKPIIHRMNLSGGGTNTDANHIAVEIENPIE
jgi:hypothetical protein